MDEDQPPSRIVAAHTRPSSPFWKTTVRDRARALKRAFFTRHGLVGDYDYAFLFTPNLPFLTSRRSKPARAAPFFGLNDRLPVVLALLLGLQHALAMLAGVITAPIILTGAAGANFGPEAQQYVVSAALIVSGVLSCIQITRFHIYKTPYYLGTGVVSVVGVSFSTITVATGAFSQMYANGYCPTAADGTKLPCPDGYGALLGTSAVCALAEVLLSFLPPKTILRIFPPLVTGPTVMLIGVSLVGSGFADWAGGSGTCMAGAAAPAAYRLCPDVTAPHALPWGSAEFLGLGFSVFATIVLCERFGAPIVKSCAVVVGLLVGCVVAAACGYFSAAGIDAAPVASFVWVHTFKLTVYGPVVLPLLAVYVICACEAIGDITATCDVSRLEVDGEVYESRIQGGVLADGCNGLLAALCTITPMSTFAQNNGVIALTRCANRKAGYCACFFLVIMGVFAKFAAALTSIPAAVIGGMTTFLFTSVAVSGIAIIARGVPFTRRNRFILTAGLAIGYGATLVPSYFSGVFTYGGDDRSLQGFLGAIELVMGTGFAVTALVTVLLNLTLPEEVEEEETVEAVGAAAPSASTPTSKSDHEPPAAAEASSSVSRNIDGIDSRAAPGKAVSSSADGSRDGDEKLA